MIDFDDCLRDGFIQKMAPSMNQAKETMKKALVLLEESKMALKANAPNSSVMAAYSAILDAARSLLFKDGYRERSHVCVVKFLEEKYSGKLSPSEIALFDQYRDKRHKTMYSGSYYMSLEDAEKVILFAEKFIEKLIKLLGVPKEDLLLPDPINHEIVELKKSEKSSSGIKILAPDD